MKASILLVLALTIKIQQGFSQGAFQNLDFEAANLSPIPPGQSGGLVPITSALPGWSGDLGSTPVTQVLQNNQTLGDASIDLLGPSWTHGGIIEGQYTVVLQPGFATAGDAYVSASISQTGLVPARARSLQFKAETGSDFSVSLGGETLSLMPLGSGANYTLYGADIAAFSGQEEALTITALAGPCTTDYFDSFDFSPAAVPEPCALSLMRIGGLAIAMHRWNKRGL